MYEASNCKCFNNLKHSFKGNVLDIIFLFIKEKEKENID